MKMKLLPSSLPSSVVTAITAESITTNHRYTHVQSHATEEQWTEGEWDEMNEVRWLENTKTDSVKLMTV